MTILAEIAAIAAVVKELVSVASTIFKFAMTQYEAAQRAAVLKEINAAIQESTQTMDNTRLMNVFDPKAAPFPRKTMASGPTPTSA